MKIHPVLFLLIVGLTSGISYWAGYNHLVQDHTVWNSDGAAKELAIRRVEEFHSEYERSEIARKELEAIKAEKKL